MEEKYKFEITSMELQIILKGLREVPYKESAHLISRLVKEYEKQVNEKTWQEKE